MDQISQVVFLIQMSLLESDDDSESLPEQVQSPASTSTRACHGAAEPTVLTRPANTQRKSRQGKSRSRNICLR